jgi:sec-independent protein translocase protein TatB
MIDLGLSKLAIIGVVALVVIGPEKLPRVARMAGTLYGRAQRYISQVKSEVSRELELEEMRRMQKEMQQAAADFQSNVTEQVAEMEADLNRDLPSLWSGDMNDVHALTEVPDPARLRYKVKEFRRKKLSRLSSVPMWYKNRSGTRARVLSGAARVAKYRSKKPSSSFY